MIRAPVFSDKQFRKITAAAAKLPRQKRNDFLTGVARRLGENPSDQAVEEAITVQLGRPPAFLFKGTSR
jgi:hypothetical protein